MGKKKFFETDDFKQQEKLWYDKLANKEFKVIGTDGVVEEEKFQDIEASEQNEYTVRKQKISKHKTKYIGGDDYYQLCQEILRNYKFKKEVHKIIFDLHAEGKPERDISEKLKKKYGVSLTQQRINQIIKHIKEHYFYGEKQ